MGREKGEVERLKGNERRRALFARHFAVRGPIITSALKLASPDPSSSSSSPSSTFNRIFLPRLSRTIELQWRPRQKAAEERDKGRREEGGDARRRQRGRRKKGTDRARKAGGTTGEYVSNVVEIFYYYLAFALFFRASRRD